MTILTTNDISEIKISFSQLCNIICDGIKERLYEDLRSLPISSGDYFDSGYNAGYKNSTHKAIKIVDEMQKKLNDALCLI